MPADTKLIPAEAHDAAELLRYRAANLIEALDADFTSLRFGIARKVVALEEAVKDYDRTVKEPRS